MSSIFFLVLFVIVLLIVGGGILFSIRSVPNFTFSRICISNLGNKSINPAFKAFNYPMIIGGLATIACVIYLYFQWSAQWSIWGVILFVLSLIGAIGMAGVGLITEDHIFKVHYAMGIFILAGFNFANLLGFVLSIESVVTTQPLPTLSDFLTLYIPILIGVVFIFIQLGRLKKEARQMDGLNRVEWMLLCLAMYWLLLMLIIF
jgi:hypothetical membrane protein